MKRGLFYPVRIFFHSLKCECFSALETTQKWWQMHMLAKGMSESPPPSQSFFWVHNISNCNGKWWNQIQKERELVFYSLESITKWKTTFAFQQKFDCCLTIYSIVRGFFSLSHPSQWGRLFYPEQFHSRLHSNITCNFMTSTLWSPCSLSVFPPKWVESQWAIKV